jgi:hypothetical protein
VICSALIPFSLPTAEPMSIQKGQPTSVAALIEAKDFSFGSTCRDFSRANSKAL